MDANQNLLTLLLKIIDDNWSSLIVCFADLWNIPWTLLQGERDGYEISYLEKGTGTLFVQDRQYRLKAGDFILVHSAEGNKFVPDEEDFWMLQSTFIFSHVKNHEQIEQLHHLIREEDFPWNINGNSGIVEKMYQMNRIISTKFEDGPIRLKSLLLDILLATKKCCRCNSISPNVKKYDQNIRIMIDNVEMYIIRNYSRKISVSELAKVALVTPQYLCKKFKLVTGKSIIEYVNSYRIQKSKKLLIYSNLSITTIANDIGFCNSQYFNRIFLRSEKMTPSEFRKSMHDFY